MFGNNKSNYNKFWIYDYCQHFELKQEFIDAYRQKGKFFEDAQYFYDYMNTSPHPVFKKDKDTIEPTSISFTNIMIDINTLKILFCLLPNTKVITLKFSSNCFEFSNFEYLMNQIMIKSTNVYNFIFEWNDEIIVDGKIYKIGELYKKTEEIISNTVQQMVLKQKQIVAKLTTHPKFDSLCLRGMFLGDEAGMILFENLKNNNSLRVLNVYRNLFTSKLTSTICQVLNVNRKIEELNLGCNKFGDDDFIAIANELGKIRLSSTEVEDYQAKLKEKNEAIEKNKKAKGNKKLEVPVPNVPDLDIVGDKYYIVKNNKVKTLNLMQNNFTNSIFYNILELQENSDELLIVLDKRIFEKNEIDKLSDYKNKYTSKIYLVK